MAQCLPQTILHYGEALSIEVNGAVFKRISKQKWEAFNYLKALHIKSSVKTCV